jgi:hypothetical protein
MKMRVPALRSLREISQSPFPEKKIQAGRQMEFITRQVNKTGKKSLRFDVK